MLILLDLPSVANAHKYDWTQMQKMVDTSKPLVTQAYVCNAPGEPLMLKDITLPPLEPTQVQVEMECCGLCHTDIHMRDNDWGISNYPLVLGHEGIGVVSHVGQSVKGVEIGERVGITWIRDSCGVCGPCLAGRENICAKGYQGTYLSSAAGIWGKEPYNEHGGCFSKVMRIEAKFAIKIPEDLPSEEVGPLMCGGGTVFEPVVNYVKSGTRVAVASIGGLGTVAIKLARLYGGHVTALSRTEAKREGALAVGAKEFYACLGNEAKMDKLAGRFDLIIDTSPVNAPLGPYLSMLKLNGTYVRVGIPPTTDMTFQYDFIPLIFTEKKIAGSIVTGTGCMAHLMELVSTERDFMMGDKENWKIEAVPFGKINDIMEILKENKNKNTYRYTLKW